jgi:hypothetical protein
MRTISTFLKKANLPTEKQRSIIYHQLQPKEDSLQKILQFASTYRVEQVSENQFVELYLN